MMLSTPPSSTLRRWLTLVSIGLGMIAGKGLAADSGQIDFNFHVRPILSDRCFKCHGPDPKGRKADLRLDTMEGATAILDKRTGARGIVPGKPHKSEVMRRVLSSDPDDQMPPPASNLALSKKEVEVLQKWIEQGAKYKSHWSFLPVKKPSVPKIRDPWIQNAIDQFVLAKLQKELLQPAGEARKETLARRVSFDLTGLPPAPDQLNSYLADESKTAFGTLVERLLASPAYGERMANDWLDLARYADTYGYQSDVDRDMFPWRDWVIRAFNENLSYADFILWQIAGDLLPDATDEQILATAFNRLHRQTNEGGSIEEEFRAEYNADRVHTFGTAFLGLTLECARCHDHKYDPITQRDYYKFFAFFNNIDESGLYSHFTQSTPTPTMFLYGDGQKKKHLELKNQIAAGEAQLKQIEKLARKRFQTWRKATNTTASSKIVPPPIARFTFEQVTSNQVTSVVGTQTGTLNESPVQVDGQRGKALKFNGENSVVFPNIARFKRTDEFTFSLSLQPTETQDRSVVFHHSKSWTDAGSRGYEMLLEKGKAQFSLVHFWPGNAISIRMREMLPLNEWTHLTITYDGSSQASGIAIYKNGERAETEVVRNNLFKDILYRAEWGDDAGGVNFTLAERFRDSGFKNGLLDDVAVFDQRLTSLQVKQNFQELTGRNVAAADLNEEFTHYLQTQDEDYKRKRTELKKLREGENAFVNDIREIMVMRELPWRRPTFLLKRGAYDAPGEPVEPGTPESIFPFPKKLPKNRLGLARWLIDPRNPLTARVVVNRIWKMHFGRGLVSTVEDFGSQGQLPVHAELLDWLTATFIETGWDVKELHRLILSSATYRQASMVSPDLLASDPDNLLLARGPKVRLPAEQIRDSALAVSGLLSSKLGGPSVKPYQPAGLWEQSGLSKTYIQDKGEGLYRRSLYTFWRRTAPPPTMLTFDATSREVCTAKRETTSTPLQALILLNDPQFIEAARVLAEKMSQHTNVSSRVEQTFRTVLGRAPSARELEISQQLFEEQLRIFASNQEAADKYLAIGDKPRDQTLRGPELAATTVLVNTLMNHDEFVMKR